MGSGWSQDEMTSPARAEEPTKTVSKNRDSNAKTTVTRTEVKLPHNYEAILKDADLPVDMSSMEKLYDQLCDGVFLNQKRKKYWIERASRINCFMLFAREFSITWADDTRFWHWPYLKESDVFVDVAELLNVCWLEVHGKFNTVNLSPGIMYEALFVVMLKDPAYGWEVPINLRLTLQDGTKQEHKEKLMDKPRGKWMEIPVGEFMVFPEKVGDIEFYMYEIEGGIWKRGLVIKGVSIRPKPEVLDIQLF